MAEQRGSVSLKSFTKWPFKDDFEIRVEQGQVVWAKCKFCSVILRDTYINEAKGRGLKGKALSGTVSYSDGVTYIHRTNFAKHVGEIELFKSTDTQRCYNINFRFRLNLGALIFYPKALVVAKFFLYRKSYLSAVTRLSKHRSA